MNRTLLGLGLLGLVAAVAVGATFVDFSALRREVTARKEPVTVSILYGGEKAALLRNPEVQAVLKDHRVTLDAAVAGSVEMSTTLDTTGRDCIWPSTSVAVEYARSAGKPVQGAETIFNSPIVFYAWAEVADALLAKGVVVARNDGILTADISKIVNLITLKTRWKEDLGLNIYGPFKVFSTNPAKSNSGNVWSGLLATVMNGGSTPNQDQLEALLPKLTAYFGAMGFMSASSGDMFESFLKQGMGAAPIIVGYENQLVEFLHENAAAAETIRTRIRTIYPEPTVFASHPLISLKPACKRLAEALQDPRLQEIAWAQHGFRTGLIGVENDPAAIRVATLPATVDLVVPMPAAPVMTAIIEAVR